MQESAANIPGDWPLCRETGCGLDLFTRPCHELQRQSWDGHEFPQDELCKSAHEAVFVVEDCPAERVEVAEVLAIAGYEVVTCANGQDFQDIASPYTTGCVLLDVHMPSIDGIAVQEWLNTSGNSLPVIFMTAAADVETAVHCMKQGAFDFLSKPLDAPSLVATVASAVGLSRKQYCARQSAAYARKLLARLTPTERRIAQMVSAGFTTKTMASALKRSENTVKIHRHRVFDKLSTASPAGVAQICRQASEDLGAERGWLRGGAVMPF